MLWAALYLAAVQLSLRKSSLTQALLYLAFAATAAVLANVLRVTSLFYLEAGIITAPAALPQSIAAHFESAVHTGTGITAFLLVALILYFADQRIKRNIIEDDIAEPVLNATPTSAAKNQSKVTAQKAGNKYFNNKYFFLACGIAAIIPFFTPQKSATKHEEQWPTTYEGQKLRPLPLTGSELEFARNFPGSIAVFQTDKQTIIIRRVRQATRQLHPAADCYRASGFTITNPRRETDRAGTAWNVLLAQKSARHLQVRERIYDENGQNYTDISQWYWAALWGQSKGPWWSITTVTALRNEEHLK
jgi:exosortase/archaeosortase family protein